MSDPAAGNPFLSTTTANTQHTNTSTLPRSATTEYQEAFALFDKRGQGRIPRESLGELLRSLGQNPTQAEVRELAGKVGPTCE
ncbi:hypothetical protein QFC24_001150 [Naganishia onofrii]|uniref:Uncharacterized protein n=1 Tax=Naganishia onofrii TaxID=1851511 RepID=A0ACC2XTX8_9TREE|nr:hypothetical protein QFC24_001150 [Naganishia onofrii]